MERIYELIQSVRKKFPIDNFFISIEQQLEQGISHVKNHYDDFNNALMILDDESWATLKEKAVKNAPDSRNGQRKQGFFNHLNEAFAYQHLLKLGYTNIKILTEGNNNKSPDISYKRNGEELYCEVKSIGISDNEITRRNSVAYVDRSMDGILSETFFNKLKLDIEEAQSQIKSQGDGLVFIIIKFDDFTGTYQETYREQIKSFINNHSITNIFIKFAAGYEPVSKNSVHSLEK
jgi:hypothetical protein